MAYELRTGDFDSFFRAPFEAYGKNTLYVSPLKSDLKRLLDAHRNPLFKRPDAFSFFSVHRDGVAVGRIVAHAHDASNQLYNLRRGYFGFFDCIDDIDAANLLLSAAEDWGRRQGYTEIAGNFNLTAMQQIGVVTDGYSNAPYTDQVYNPPHIPQLLEKLGYAKFFPMRTFELDLQRCNAESLRSDKQRALLSDPTYTWERLRIRGFSRLLDAARVVLNDGFVRNAMFVPLTREEYFFQGKEMMWVIDQRIAPLVYHAGHPIGVAVCIPDLNPLLRNIGSCLSFSTPIHYWRHWRKRQRAVIIYYSVAYAYQGRGVMGAVLGETIDSLKAAGYTHLGITWIADENLASLRQMEKLGARQLHRTHLFRKQLVPL